MPYASFKRGRNQNLRCTKCSRIKNEETYAKQVARVSHADRRVRNYQKIKETVESLGAVLLTPFDEYKDKSSYIRFGCSLCGTEHKIRWSKFEEGRNPNLLCEKCMPEKRIITTDLVRREFARYGVELLNEYVNIKSPLLFHCKQCGKSHSNTYGLFCSGRNLNFLCTECQKGNITTEEPLSIAGSYSEGAIVKATKADARCRIFIKTFFNLNKYKDSDQSFESHHIKPRNQFPSLQYSLPNLYPLPFSEHHTNNFNYYHKLEESRNPENWPQAARLPYHDYRGFKFLNLNEYFVTDLILEETNEKFYYDTKVEYAKRGILYIPFYFNELDVYKSSLIAYSMLRNRYAKKFGNIIYAYTGQDFIRYNTRKLIVKAVNNEDEFKFFSDYHIQGYLASSVCLGLYTVDDKLISAMSFREPKSANWRGENHFELLRFCSKLNSSVPGAASKLFKYFVDHYNSELVVTFCDVRFSSINPLETVYPKLGFDYDGYSRPNYKYYKDGQLYSRQKFMKSRLDKLLPDFDPNLTEFENMRRNGYARLYDCGNFRFVWRRPQSL